MAHQAIPPLHTHGILHERFAELSTDAYRSQMLEASGYRAQVVEFIDLEHTARNLLIRAVRKSNGRGSKGARQRADALAIQLGVDNPILAQLLDGHGNSDTKAQRTQE